jgi:CPA1 family monovalent cation:H+ antiporter
MQWMLEKFNLIGDQRLSKEYSQLLARQSALKRVIEYLDKLILTRDRNLELCESKRDLIQKQLLLIEAEIIQQQIKHPQLDSFMIEKLEENLLNIESDTYAELIRSGRLDNDLTPLLEELFAIKET